MLSVGPSSSSWPMALVLLGAAASAGPAGRLCDNSSEQHTGFLPAGPDASYFYWLAESRSKAPRLDPLILWMTGGPGCSSILALLTENGPCKLQAAGHRWRSERNPYSWTEAGNVLWVDQPAGVGFSTGETVNDEAGVARRMVSFMEAFYGRYPWLLSVPLFIMGESFAGHYVPAVGVALLRAKQADVAVGQLHGVAIGNGVVDPIDQFASKPIMAFTGGAGQGGSLEEGVVDASVFEAMSSHLPLCLAGIRLCQQDPGRADCADAYEFCAINEILPVQTAGRNPYDARKLCSEANPVNCYDFSAEKLFLTDPRVQDALGVPPGSKWSVCNMLVNLGFVLSGDFLSATDSLVTALLTEGVPVLVYAGDTDLTVDWLGAKSWMERLPWHHREAWLDLPDVDFHVEGRPMGRERSVAGFTFLQIYDSGHLVPMDQPEVALTMVREFISPASRWRRSELVALDVVVGETHPALAVALVILLVGALVMAHLFLAKGSTKARSAGRLQDGAYGLLHA